MRLGLRACIALVLAACCWPLIVATDLSAEVPAAEEAETHRPPVQLVEALQPPAATEVQPPVQPAPQRLPRLQEIPETTVVGQPSGVGAQGNVVGSGTLLQTPNLTPTTLGQTGSSVSIITEEQIRQRQQPMVQEMLKGLPGVYVNQNGGPGQLTSVFIRGATSEQTKVLLDGIPVNDPSSPGRGFDFSNMAVDNIERIEVIRGPQSTLYGSDAIGGVINIITKKGQGRPTPRVSLQGGAYNYSQELANISGGTDTTYYSFGGSYIDTTSFSAADSRLPGNTEVDPFRLGTVSSRVGWAPSDTFDIDFVTRYNQANVKNDQGGGIAFDDPNNGTFTENINTRLQLRLATPNQLWEQKLSYSTSNYTRRNEDASDPMNFGVFGLFQNNGLTQLLDWRNNFILHETNTFTVGTWYQQENIVSQSVSQFGFPPATFSYNERAISDTAVYAQDQINLFGRWFTTVGVRQDNYSLAGVATTTRVTSLYRLPITQTAIRGSYGTGFKAPTLTQLFDNSFGAFAINNPALRPERSEGYDFGFDQPFFNGRLVAGATVFRNDFADLIVLRSTAPFTLDNVRRAAASGTEATVALTLRRGTTITANWTHTDAFNLDTSTRLLRRPTDTAFININQAMLRNRANANASIYYVNVRDDNLFSNLPPFAVTPVSLPGYVLVNTAGSFRVRPGFELFGRVDNLFNQVYEQIAGFGTAGVSFFGGGTWTR